MRRLLSRLSLGVLVMSLTQYAIGQTRTARSVGGSRRATTKPIVLASRIKNPSQCRVDSDHVYWLEANSRISRTRKDGGVSAPVVSDDGIRAFALDETYVYYLTETDLKKVSKAGGSPLSLGRNFSNLDLIVLDDTNAYWLAHKEREAGIVMTTGKSSGDPSQLASGIKFAKGLLVDSEHVYWADYADDTLKRVKKSGGQTETLTRKVDFNLPESFISAPEQIAADQNGIYWACVLGCIVKIDKVSGRATGLLAAQKHSAYRLAVDDFNLYWVSASSDRLMKIDKNGGKPSTLAARRGSPSSVAVDEKYVYWTNSTSGEVLKIAK